MIREFSSGYYHTTMDVQEYDDGPLIDKRLYKFINEEIYLDSDAPVMMRLGLDEGPLFSVNPGDVIPRDVLALPPEISNDAGKTSVFVLKSQYADTVGEYHG